MRQRVSAFVKRAVFPVWFFGDPERPCRYLLARFLFLRGVAVVYFVAFVSLWAQIQGLAGSRGILPIADLMARLGERWHWWTGFFRFPTLCWFSASDLSLSLQCAAGTLLAILCLCNVAPRLCLGVLWFLYLSLTHAGQDFLSFQWDVLLTEAGFLGIFLAPRGIWPGMAPERPPSRAFLLLGWWALFRLYFQAGGVKLLSGDLVWRDLTALSYHYWTQPLPAWPAWYVWQLPMWLHQVSAFLMFVIELGFPFLIFATRRLRLLAFFGFTGLLATMSVTGNYTFFHLLLVSMSFLLLDDAIWERCFPRRFRGLEVMPALRHPPWVAVPRVCLIVTLVLFSVAQLLVIFPFARAGIREIFLKVPALLAWNAVNAYGLFADMTEERKEIEIEGSSDGVEWKAYGFRYKPQDPGQAPRFVAPHQPRLDWQMWFEALRPAGMMSRWFLELLKRLLEGSEDVLALLGSNPFPEAPPQYVRVLWYDYRFTDAQARRRTGNWWDRSTTGLVSPLLTLGKDGSLRVAR